MFARAKASSSTAQSPDFVRNQANELLNYYSAPDSHWPIFSEFLERVRVACNGPMDAHAGPIRLAFTEIDTEVYFEVEYRGVGYGKNNSIELETIVSVWKNRSEEALLSLKRKLQWKPEAQASP